MLSGSTTGRLRNRITHWVFESRDEGPSADETNLSHQILFKVTQYPASPVVAADA